MVYFFHFGFFNQTDMLLTANIIVLRQT